jgi:hypothetical protein
LAPETYRILAIIIVVVALPALYILVSRLIRSYLKFRGTRIIQCPDTQAPAAVKVDALHAAASSLKSVDLRLGDCSRWPEHKDCGQHCLAQIEASPEDCLLRTMLARWYSDKSCAICGAAMGDIDWLHHKPALLSPSRSTLEWNSVAPEQLPGLLTTHKAICWNCHIASMFRREHPELVIDRPWRKQ